MSADEIIIMLIEQLQGKAVMYDVTPELAIAYAVDHLQDRGWRRDGLTGETWIAPTKAPAK